MTLSRAKIILVFLVCVLLFSILSLLYWDFVRNTIIVPIYYVLWVINLFLNSFPQGLYFVFLVILSLIIGAKTLESIRVEPGFNRRERTPPQAGTQYLHWRNLYTNMYISSFSRNRFAGEARKLILSILAYEQGINASEAEVLVRNGLLDVPDTIRNLIETKTFPDVRFSNRIIGTILRLRELLFKVDSKKDPQIDKLITEIIDFIEYRLEINHAGHQPKA